MYTLEDALGNSYRLISSSEPILSITPFDHSGFISKNSANRVFTEAHSLAISVTE
jgi:hypothetical protein